MDYLTLETAVKVFRGAAPTPASVAAVTEMLSQQYPLAEMMEYGPFTVVAGASAVAIPAIPHPPYDVLLLVPDSAVKANINSQGYQQVRTMMLTMAQVTTCLFTNDLVPAGQTVPVDVHVRYLLAKFSA